jgi:hypothetical protein
MTYRQPALARLQAKTTREGRYIQLLNLCDRPCLVHDELLLALSLAQEFGVNLLWERYDLDSQAGWMEMA